MIAPMWQNGETGLGEEKRPLWNSDRFESSIEFRKIGDLNLGLEPFYR